MDDQQNSQKGVKPIKVSVIVTAYNNLKYTQECIESFYQHTQDIEVELITINNGSKDGTEKYLSSLPNKKKISFSENIGVDKAINYGINMAEGIYTLNLSNDIVVTKNWLTNLVTCMESDARIGMVVPACTTSSNIQQVNLKYDNLDQMQIEAEKFNRGNPNLWEDRLRLITYTCLFRTEILQKIGGFDEDFNPGGYDDDAMAFRIRRMGYRLMLAADTFVHHYGSATFKTEYKKNNLMQRNHDLFMKKYGVNPIQASFIDFNVVKLVDYSRGDGQNEIRILGIGPSCGSTLLQVKNHYRKNRKYQTQLYYLSQEEKYVEDLRTICADVVLGNTGNVKVLFKDQKYDVIVVESDTNGIENITHFYQDLGEMLTENGQLITTAEPAKLPVITSSLHATGISMIKSAENRYFSFGRQELPN